MSSCTDACELPLLWPHSATGAKVCRMCRTVDVACCCSERPTERRWLLQPPHDSGHIDRTKAPDVPVHSPRLFQSAHRSDESLHSAPLTCSRRFALGMLQVTLCAGGSCVVSGFSRFVQVLSKKKVCMPQSLHSGAAHLPAAIPCRRLDGLGRMRSVRAVRSRCRWHAQPHAGVNGESGRTVVAVATGTARAVATWQTPQLLGQLSVIHDDAAVSQARDVSATGRGCALTGQFRRGAARRRRQQGANAMRGSVRCTGTLALAVGSPRRTRGVRVGAVCCGRTARRAGNAAAQLQKQPIRQTGSSPQPAVHACEHDARLAGESTSVVTGFCDVHIDSATGTPFEPCRGSAAIGERRAPPCQPSTADQRIYRDRPSGSACADVAPGAQCGKLTVHVTVRLQRPMPHVVEQGPYGPGDQNAMAIDGTTHCEPQGCDQIRTYSTGETACAWQQCAPMRKRH